jgi:RNA polymerase sigma-70 factor, ECF subfamily
MLVAGGVCLLGHGWCGMAERTGPEGGEAREPDHSCRHRRRGWSDGVISSAQGGGPTGAARAVASGEDLERVAALRRGDETAFVELVRGLHGSMMRLAMAYVSSQAIAEEVVQEAWLGVLRQIHNFEGRSSLKTWILRIAANLAKTRGAQERRSVPFSAMAEPGAEAGEPPATPARFFEPGHRWAGHWAAPPSSWKDVPEERLLAMETTSRIRRAIDELPPSQRAVITLRDVEGWSASEVCDLLELSEANQRVLLHRGRCKVRAALERYLEEAKAAR